MLGAWVSTIVLAATIEVGVGPETITEALETAAPGDEIIVPAGVWDEPLFIDQAVTLTGVDGPVLTASPEGGDDPIVVQVVGNGPVTLRGFTLDRRDNLPPTVVATGTDLRLEDTVFVGTEDRLGSDLIANNTTLTVLRGSFEVPNAYRFDFNGHVELTDGSATFEDTLFAGGTGDVGGGLFLNNTDAVLRGCTFSGNAAGDGGALAVLDGTTTTIEDCLFENNHAIEVAGGDGLGGAIRQEGGNLVVVRTTLRANTAVGAGAVRHDGASFTLADSVVEGHLAYEVAGVSLFSVDVATILRSEFVDNVSSQIAQGITGALAIRGDTAGLEVGGNLFCGNDTGASGGAIYIDVPGGDALGTVHHNRFVGNSAENGAAAIRVAGIEIEVAQNTFVDSANPGGGSVAAESAGRLVLVNNAFVDSDGGAVLREDGAVVDGDYDLYSGNDVDFVNANPGEHDVHAPPGFVRHVAGDCTSDLRPASGSALVDAGDPARLDDDGTRSDIGAFGGAGASSLLDVDGDGVIDGDCDPYDAGVGPLVPEIPADGIDQDCDGIEPCYVDGDGDGAGTAATLDGPVGCEAPGVAAVDGDCDDDDASVIAQCAADDHPSDLSAEEDEALPPSWFCATGGRGGTAAWLVALLVVRRRRRPVLT